MFGSVMLDVAIGLALIYLLYSLLASTLHEIIASFFGLRAAKLKKALRRMLVDDDPNSPLSKRLFNGFMEHPLIKYMNPGAWPKRTPSFVAPEDFSRVLTDCLKKSGGAEYKEALSLPVLSAGLEKLKVAAPTEASPLRKFFGFAGKLLRHLFRKEAPQLDQQNPSDTIKLLESYLSSANNDLEKFRKYLEMWFDGMMDRVSGWYKRQTQLYIFIIGLLLAAGFNVDSINIVRILSKNKDARTQLVSIADTYTKNGKTLPKKDSVQIDSLVLLAAKEINGDINSANNILGIGWKESPQAYFSDSTTSNTSSSHNSKSWDWKKMWLALLGWLITAVAVSLGAPFWFDLLSKFMNLRGTGDKPASPTKTEQAKVPLVSRKG